MMAAILYRAWKGRVKGRNFYGLIWYIQNKIPPNISYLEACIKKSGNFEIHDSLTRDRLIEMLHSKIQSVDWESAKADMRSFIADPERLDVWSAPFFSALIYSSARRIKTRIILQLF
jgi:hypothetical protein